MVGGGVVTVRVVIADDLPMYRFGLRAAPEALSDSSPALTRRNRRGDGPERGVGGGPGSGAGAGGLPG